MMQTTPNLELRTQNKFSPNVINDSITAVEVHGSDVVRLAIMPDLLGSYVVHDCLRIVAAGLLLPLSITVTHGHSHFCSPHSLAELKIQLSLILTNSNIDFVYWFQLSFSHFALFLAETQMSLSSGTKHFWIPNPTPYPLSAVPLLTNKSRIRKPGYLVVSSRLYGWSPTFP